MKKFIITSTSLRHGSNSDMLAEKFVEGAGWDDEHRYSIVAYHNEKADRHRVMLASFSDYRWEQVT